MAHELLFKTLIKNWREAWKENDLPFYYVQLSSINRPTWPEFRDSQRRLLDEIPLVAMAVSSDWGDSLDVHPIHKEPIGERLALQALHHTYNYSLVPSGPLFMNASFGKSHVMVDFRYGNGLEGAGRQNISGFEIASADGVFYPATVKVMGSSIRLSHKKIKNPYYVRYGWQPYTTANLINSSGLPASTFRASKTGKYK